MERGTPKTEVARSAGGVVLDDSEQVALTRVRKPRGDQWKLPKGRVEAGESQEQAALREVLEETGIAAEIVAGLGAIDYWFVWGSTRYHKFVEFYLMRPVGGRIGDHDHEVEEARWVPAPEAEGLLTFESEREILRRALAVPPPAS